MWNKALSALFFILLVFSLNIFAQDDTLKEPEPKPEPEKQEIISYKPRYIPPLELSDLLGVKFSGNVGILKWRQDDDRWCYVEVRNNASANLILISGTKNDIEFVRKMIEQIDIPPRQIEIEVQIVEVSKSKARNLGIDWDRLWQDANPTLGVSYNRSDDDIDNFSRDQIYGGGVTLNRYSHGEDKRTYNYRDYSARAIANLDEAIRLLDSKGAGTVRNAPKILTLNNRTATILDGQRVTYITRYSSYTNLFETDSLDAGLNLTVKPSIGESGYITMDITAEFTSLDSDISGSPVKNGQMLDNTIIVKDGESIFLGGLTRYVDTKEVKRFPLLGHVIPFLFSNEVTVKDEVESIIVLTPRVIDFTNNLTEEHKALLENN